MAETVHIRHSANPRGRVRRIHDESWPEFRMQGFVQCERDDKTGHWVPTVAGKFAGPPEHLKGYVEEDKSDIEQWVDDPVGAVKPAVPAPAGKPKAGDQP